MTFLPPPDFYTHKSESLFAVFGIVEIKLKHTASVCIGLTCIRHTDSKALDRESYDPIRICTSGKAPCIPLTIAPVKSKILLIEDYVVVVICIDDDL